MVTEGIIIAFITVFGGAIVKILYDIAQARKDNQQLHTLLETQAKRVKRRNAIMTKFNMARDERAAVFDEYDLAIKHLSMDHARSYISGNDTAALKEQLDKAERARLKYKTANAEYYVTLHDINKQLLDLDGEEE